MKTFSYPFPLKVGNTPQRGIAPTPTRILLLFYRLLRAVFSWPGLTYSSPRQGWQGACIIVRSTR